MKILIVGGGIGGMCLAICLARIGVSVDLVELDANWRSVGAGLSLNEASLRAFEKVGVLDRMRAEGDVHAGLMLCDVAGTPVGGADRTGAPAKLSLGGGILRPVLHRILVDATLAGGVDVKLAVTASRLTQSSDHVEVVFSDGRTAEYDLVVGADGLHSKVRKLIFPEAQAPRFTGQGCWRAVFPRRPEVQTTTLYLNSFHKAGLNPVSRDEMYLFLLESVPDNAWMPPERWPELLRERLLPFGGTLAELREMLDETSQINYRPLEMLLLPAPWFKGRVLLIGDAAHATTPHCAYGAGLAVEDANVLAELLESTSSIDVALERFMERRYSRCRVVVEGSCRLGELEMSHASVDEHQAVTAKMASIIAEPA